MHFGIFLEERRPGGTDLAAFQETFELAEAAEAWVPLDQLPALDSLSFDHGDTVRAYLAAHGRLPLVPVLV